MGLAVVFVSGIRRSGKSAIIQTMIERLWKHPPHYIRLVKAGSDKTAPAKSGKPPQSPHVRSARWIEFHEDRIFEVLPEALSAIHREDRFGSVVIEADSDPVLRCAYPYDHRVFVMPAPGKVHEVFRDPHQAAKELRQALDDTAAFASEIFGLFKGLPDESAEPSEVRPEFSATHMRGFLYSPLGDELATRIQLQQPYHGLVESDVIIVNTKLGRTGAETEECVRRIASMLSRVRGASGRRNELFFCDPSDLAGKECKALLKALKPMCVGGK